MEFTHPSSHSVRACVCAFVRVAKVTLFTQGMPPPPPPRRYNVVNRPLLDVF